MRRINRKKGGGKMKKTLLICVALVVGVANTAYSIPVQEFDAGKTEVLILDERVTPFDFTLSANTSVSFEAISSSPQLASANDTAFANWTPNWFNRPSWFNRPDWSNFHYDLFSYFTYCPKNNPGGPTTTVPEPGTILLLGSALIGLACISRKRMKS